jgi:hypothetical protein
MGELNSKSPPPRRSLWRRIAGGTLHAGVSFAIVGGLAILTFVKV